MRHSLLCAVACTWVFSLPAIAATQQASSAAIVANKEMDHNMPGFGDDASSFSASTQHHENLAQEQGNPSLDANAANSKTGMTDPVKTLAATPQEIPLIETQNEAQSSAEITFVTGGIGEDEKKAIEAAKADYNLYITSANAGGAFIGDARVVITHKKQDDVQEILDVVSGPLLYVKLPAGAYLLEASLGEQKQQKAFTIDAKLRARKIHLRWNTKQGN